MLRWTSHGYTVTRGLCILCQYLTYTSPLSPSPIHLTPTQNAKGKDKKRKREDNDDANERPAKVPTALPLGACLKFTNVGDIEWVKVKDAVKGVSLPRYCYPSLPSLLAYSWNIEVKYSHTRDAQNNKGIHGVKNTHISLIDGRGRFRTFVHFSGKSYPKPSQTPSQPS